MHFQTTDVHWPWTPPAPFAGLFIRPELRERYYERERQLIERSGRRSARRADPAALAEMAIDPVVHSHARRGLYDEAMAHQDYQLGRLVERLKARGDWDRTLLIVAADHGQDAAGLAGDPLVPPWGPLLQTSYTRIPLIVIWPGHIAGGQRFSQPVSMIDMLPTILDLADLPMPEVIQGQSLAPLFLAKPAGSRGR